MTKSEIRKEIRNRQSGLSRQWIETTSNAVQKRLLALPEFEDAGVVGCYMAVETEVRTNLIIEECLKEDRKLFLPAISSNGDFYEMTEYRRGTSLKAGPFGVPEPVEGERILAGKVELMVTPGLAFDRFGGRVGHGGGHYDRMMQGEDGSCFKAAIAFEFQMFDKVPVEKQDVLMNAVITEAETVRC